MQLLRYILLPIVPIYYLVTSIRNFFYDKGIFIAKSYNVPIICIGNLSTGGTGKSPMVEYLIRFLRPKFNLAILSRGYKRASTGYILADSLSPVEAIGDEPYQFKRKFPDIQVAVDSDRRRGISKLLNLGEPPEVILLDDAYQHRKVKAGYNILLTAYNDLYVDDFVLPTGNLRESKSGARRANVVIVTKCPNDIKDNDKNNIQKKLNLASGQALYFSSIDYSKQIKGRLQSLGLNELIDKEFTLVTGIANAQHLVDFLESQNLQFEHLEYSDHHNFTTTELNLLQKKSFILTTEKDYGRLASKLKKDDLYYLPIEIKIDGKGEFEKGIAKFCSTY